MTPTTDAPLITVLDAGHLLDGGLDWGDVASLGRLEVYPSTALDDIVTRAAEASVVLTNKTPLAAETIAALPALRFIDVLATGYNVVDVAAARARGIPVSNVPAYGTESVAQHAFALILELCNRVGAQAAAVADGHWTASREWCAPLAGVTELDGLCLGIVGRGRIARRVAEIGRAFGMRVVIASPSHPSGGHGLAPLDEVAARADILSLHCQLTAANAKMIDAEFLRRMKSTAFLVNTARGGLIDERALADALTTGVIAGAALDVLTVEPPPAHHPLCSLPNCLVTPHVAWMGPQARRRLIATAAQNIRAFLAGQPVNVVNP
jgi:glycerate dehydrogenase